eukprot:3158779-Prorocentrum_lima.AAC.1
MPLADPQDADPSSSEHHERIPERRPCFNPLLDFVCSDKYSPSPDSDGYADGEPAAVARSCSLKEALSKPRARAALDYAPSTLAKRRR